MFCGSFSVIFVRKQVQIVGASPHPLGRERKVAYDLLGDMMSTV